MTFNPKPLLSTKISELADLGSGRDFYGPFFEQVYWELEQKGIKFRPHFWISDEWFVPDGITGVAVPFFLISRELRRLEKAQIGFLDGASRKSILKLVRHEVGHAFENAYKTRRLSIRVSAFGDSRKVRYPGSYRPEKPFSNDFVCNINSHYAQAHPDEDFAETFAVWLDPNSKWQTKYKGKALEKLYTVEQIVRKVSAKPQLLNFKTMSPASRDHRTLRQYYREKRMALRIGEYSKIDERLSEMKGLKKIEANSKKISGTELKKRLHRDVGNQVALGLGVHRYKVDLVLDRLFHRIEELGLGPGRSISYTKAEFLDIVTDQTLEDIRRGRDSIVI